MSGSNFLKEANIIKGGYSKTLTDFVLKYATRLSYTAVEELVKDTCGNSTISDQQIWRLVQAHALEISAKQAQQIETYAADSAIINVKEVDIYSPKAAEVIYLCDDVCVKEQKPERDSKVKERTNFCNTRISMVQKPDGTYQPIIAGFGIDNILHNKATIWKIYGQQPLPIVAISDGATSLKNDLKKIFGGDVVHILDWFHLDKKVHQTMTMITDKTSRLVHNEQILSYLWEGKTKEAILYLQEIKAKNEVSKQMLITYLTKNESTIINYKKRGDNGKIIGSGRTEKANDIFVAKRQKYNGMAWTPKGSLAITLTTANMFAT